MRVPALLLAIVVAAVAVTGCGRGQGRSSGDVLARVNGQAVTKAELDDALEKSDNGDAAKRTLDSLIVRELIREEAQRRNIQVSKQELDRRLAGLRDYVLAMTGKDYRSWLADTGQTEGDVRTRMSLQILTAKLVLTDTDRQNYFQENQDRLRQMPHNNESVIYREIVLPSQQEAEAVRNELLGKATQGTITGANFARMAEQRTLNPNERSRGGMAGWVVKGKAGDAKVEQALFSLKPGEISQPMPAPSPAPPAGQKPPATAQQPQLYRIVMVEKHLTPGPLTMENNEDIIEEWMMSDPRYQAQLQEFFSNLRAKASIEVVDPRFRSLAEAYRQGREARAKQRMSQPGAMAPAMPQPGGQPPAANAPAPVPTAPPSRGR